ncbi:MAG: class I SAM-dependent methyltransferase [Alphaproteobacteria bacterium]|nr:class I SAM-dependent methyltransferase [Alphaproteobacteria bacterium]
MSSELDRHSHWEGVYSTKLPTEVSWFQTRPDVSLELIKLTGARLDATIVDIGGGASTLLDHLLTEGRSSLIVLDLAESALAHSRSRLGGIAADVEWIATDVTRWRPERRVHLWHDRAVMHFLTEARDQAAYVQSLRAALHPGGWAIIAGFAPGGARRCSGLDIVQHDAASLQALLGDNFALMATREETHRTPSGADQLFRYHLFKRQQDN